MTLFEDSDLAEIIPFDIPQFKEAMVRVLEHPTSTKIVEDYFPGWDFTSFCEYARQLEDIELFQLKLVTRAIHEMLARTSGGLTVSGLDHISPQQSYTFISNHRDILLDPALFTQHLVSNSFHTPWICFGDNLLKSPLVSDLVKMNKGLTVKRNLAARDLMKWSFVLSTAISKVRSSGSSVWIAQREGRAKDGNDETQPAVVKMMSLAANDDWIDHFQTLRLVPVAVSYEFEPCGFRKAREVFLTRKMGTYRKSDDEDLLSMKEGIKMNKGRIHLSIGDEISDRLESLRDIKHRNLLMKAVGIIIDEQIQRMYRRWSSNYIAFDMLNNSTMWSNMYTPAEVSEFKKYMESGFSDIPVSDREGVERCFLELYARPVPVTVPDPSPTSL
jgi:1-acyl-sn-glycerol-3-phosphate acyltransferase